MDVLAKDLVHQATMLTEEPEDVTNATAIVLHVTDPALEDAEAATPANS